MNKKDVVYAKAAARRLWDLLADGEVETLIEFARFKAESIGGGDALARTIGSRLLASAMRREIGYRRRFSAFDACFRDEDFRLAAKDMELERHFVEEEWRDAVARLPLKVRKLIEFAEDEYSRPEGWIQRPDAIRACVRHRWIVWNERHSDWEYRKTRKALVRFLRDRRFE